MSVFTLPADEELTSWLEHYAIGRLLQFEGIAGGVQNSNFFVTTTLGRYVLTLFEDISRADLPYYLHLMAHLARHGLPVPAPIAKRDDNEYLGTLSGKPAVLVLRLAGESVAHPTPEHCARMGAMIAGMHLAGLSYGRRQPNPRGAAWRAQTGARLRAYLPEDEAAMLDAELRFQASADFSSLPSGAVHGDLFRDNVLWADGFIGGVIDFYFAGFDALLFDLAVTANDWCSTESGELDAQRLESLLASYHSARPFTPAERLAWPAMLRAAALRFWLSRATDYYLPRPGKLVSVKNPAEYRDILRHRAYAVPPLP